MQERDIKIDSEEWRIITAYSNNELEKIKKIVDDRIKIHQENNLIILGDLNARNGGI